MDARLLQELQAPVSITSNADELLHNATPEAGHTGEHVGVCPQPSVGIIPVGGTRHTLLQIAAPLFGCQQGPDVLPFHKMHARLHAIHRPEVKGRLRRLRCRELFGYGTGALRRLLKLCEQPSPLLVSRAIRRHCQ